MRVLPDSRIITWVATIIVAALVVPWPVVLAHEGETHAEPASTPVALEGSNRISVSGHGDAFEVILKYSPFESGTDVPLTAYILDAGTNEPARGARVTGTLSSGADSRDVSFVEAANGLPGSYGASVKVEGQDRLTWLFDITAGEKSDLVAVDGFMPGGGVLASDAHVDAKKSPSYLELTRTQAVLAALVIVIATASLLRVSRRLPNAAKGKRT